MRLRLGLAIEQIYNGASGKPHPANFQSASHFPPIRWGGSRCGEGLFGNGCANSEQAIAEVQLTVDEAFHNRSDVSVLEAGCGSTTRLRLPQGARVTGIDISSAQLRRNHHLTERILGDIQHYQFGDARFDLVICWNVLEHLSDPGRAFNALVGVLARGGILVIAVPVLWSVKGLVTRLTPFIVHVWFYRLMGDKRPLTELDQFPTHLRAAMMPQRLRERACGSGLTVRFYNTFEDPVQRDFRARFPAGRLAFAMLGGISSWVTLGRYNVSHSEAVLVLERPLGSAPRPFTTPPHWVGSG